MAWLDKKQCKQFVKIAVATKREPIAENPEGECLFWFADVQILAFLAKRGKGGADRLIGKNRDAVELALDGVAVDFIEEI